MFSSCLENIEPEGIADLRGAKAELLRAQTALVEAKAARENAEAAIAQAKAKVEEAIAKQEEALAKKMEAEARIKELEAAKQEALDAIEIEQAIAEAEALKAQAELEAQIAAAYLEAELVEAQTSVLTAKASYEEAVKNLALAMNGLTDKQIAYLKPYQYKVNTAQSTVDAKSDSLSAAAINLKAAIANLDEKKASAVVLRHYEKAIIKAEAKLKGLEEVVAMFEAAMELDPKYTDWAEKIDELKAERDAKNLAFAEGETERRERRTELTAVKDTLKAAYEEYEAATGFDFEEATGEFNDDAVNPSLKKELPYPDVYIPSPKDEDGYNLFADSYGNGQDINWKGYKYADVLDNQSQPTGEKVKVANDANPFDFFYKDTEAGLYETTVVEAFDAQIEYYAGINADDYEAQVAGNLASIKAQEEIVEEAMADYEDAVAAYKAGDPTAYYKARFENYDIETPVAEYNAALKAMVDALNTYNAEVKKYEAADTEEAEKAAQKKYEDTKNAAYAVYMNKRQTALNDYNKARVAFEKAYYTFDRAQKAYYAVLDATIETVGAIDTYPVVADRATVATNLTAAIEQYATDKAAGGESFDADGKYAAAEKIYVAELKKVNDAQKLYDDADVTNKADAVAVWTAAKEAFTKAGGNADLTPATWTDDESYKTNSGAYSKTVSDAKNAYYAIAGDGTVDFEYVTGSAWETYQDTLEDLGVGATGMDDLYKTHLWDNYEDAVEALIEAIGEIETWAIIEGENVEVVMGDEDGVQFGRTEDLVNPGNYVYPEYPDYLVDEETQALKEIKVADVVDKEFFLAEVIKPMADGFSETAYVNNVDYFDPVSESYKSYYFEIIGAPEDYPLSLPTYESFTKAIEPFEGETMYAKAKAYAVEAYRVYANELTAAGHYVDRSQTPNPYFYGTMSTFVFDYKYQNELLAEAIANVDKAAEHVKVLEAAKAEFEAWAAEEEARIDALRPRVEAEWMDVATELAEINDAETAHAAEVKPITDAISDLDSLVTNYVKIMAPKWNDTTNKYDIVEQSPTDGDLEAFVAGLQEAYNKAVLEVGDCEAELEDAKTKLEKAKAGDWSYNSESSSAQVTAVKLAQAAYDKAAAELEYALSRLAEATEALKAAMEAIGAVEPEAEETPAE